MLKNESENENNSQDEIQIELEFQLNKRELERIFEQDRRMLEEHSDEMLNDEMKRVQHEYDLLINTEAMVL